MFHAPRLNGRVIRIRQFEQSPLRQLCGVLIAVLAGATFVHGGLQTTISRSGSVNGSSNISHFRTTSVSAGSLSIPLNSVLQGRILDSNGAPLPAVKVTAINVDTNISRSVQSDTAGFYQFSAMPVGAYQITSQLIGFQTQVVENVRLEVGRTVVLNLQLAVGSISEEVRIESSTALVNLENVSVGQIINERTVQEIPLNGRYFVDLGLLIPGSVTPPQNGNLSRPTRGGGSMGLNTSGNREDTVNFQINGINLNDQLNNVLTFNPPLTSVREFKIDNSTFSAEYGRNSGAVINVATRSGTRDFHGELYEFLRNDALDARNFFNFASPDPPPFKRNQFGGAIGGPVIFPRFGEGGTPAWSGKDSTFFFFTYESLQQRQGVDLNTVVLSDAQRSSVTDPVIRRLVETLPRANIIDSSGVARFNGSSPASGDVRQWTLDLSHNFSAKDSLHGYYANQNFTRNEPTSLATTIPGFGSVQISLSQILTVNETHVFSPNLVNEVRFGFNRIDSDTKPAVEINPASFGINNGVDIPIGLPQMTVSGAFSFGGPARLPAERKDTTVILSNTVSYTFGTHSLKFGGEYRLFNNYNSTQDTGAFIFPNIPAFIAGNANSFAITLGDVIFEIRQHAFGSFIQDSFKWRPNFTLDLGFRYDLYVAPFELDNRSIVFDPATVSLLRVGRDIDKIYLSNKTNFQPRVGFAWDPFKDGKTSVRAAYGIYVEQPLANAATFPSQNRPLVTPLLFTGPVRLDNAITLATAAGLVMVTVDHNYKNSNVQSWNLNVQREVAPNLALMIGYFGSKGTHLRIARNINQPLNGVRPFQNLSQASPELPGTPLGNIVYIEGSANSSYNALWSTLTKRFARGLQLNASYTWSKSIDYNSFSSPANAVTVQNSYDVRNDRGLSDFDAGHRLVLSSIYELPFKGNRMKEGWQIGAIVQLQTGNPVNIVTNSSTVNGIANTVRPDVVGPVNTVGLVERWFDPTSFVAVPRFGNLGRNVIIGPGFSNIDLSILKNTKINERVRLQFRAEFFDAFNKANFGQPGRIVGSASFGQVTNTRFPTGDSGSSRQMQLVFKLIF